MSVMYFKELWLEQGNHKTGFRDKIKKRQEVNHEGPVSHAKELRSDLKAVRKN